MLKRIKSLFTLNPVQETGNQELLDENSLRLKADKGDLESKYRLGVMYECGKGVEINYVEALSWYRKAAEDGDDKAQFKLGLLYARGDGVEKNRNEALLWFQLAADKGNRFALQQYRLLKAQEHILDSTSNE